MLVSFFGGEGWSIAQVAKLLSNRVIDNTPDSFLNSFTRLSGLMVQGLGCFFKVSPALNLGKKIPPTSESGFEPQNLLKFCPDYWNLGNQLKAG